MRSLLIALPLLVGFVQDEAAIQDMIRRLDDADLETREKAVKELVAAGSKALDPLRKAATSESAEVRARATQAIRAIELAISVQKVYPDHKPLALKRTGTVGEILEDLARLTGVRIDASPEQRALKGSVEAGTLLQALDQICSGQDRLTYTAGDDGTVRFSSDRHIVAPASYVEAFKVYLTQAEIVRKSDYKETTIGGTLSLHTAWDGRLEPLKRLRYESLAAKDDAGRNLEIVAATMENMFRLGGGGGALVFAGLGEMNDGGGPQAFAIKGLVPESKSVASLTGKVTVEFPLARVDVVFEDPQAGERNVVGDFSIKLKEVSKANKKIKLTFTRTKGEVTGLKDEIAGRLDAGNAMAVDEDGKEHVGEIGPFQQDPAGGAMVIMGGPGGGEAAKTATFQASFPTLGDKDIKRFKFRFSESLFEKTVSFEIKDIKLP